MKKAIYLRVSSKSQDYEMQRTDLVRYCETHGYAYDIFEEKESGKNDNRPELKRMMAKVQECHYDGVIVWRLDRLGRSVKHLSQVIAEIESAKCRLISFKEHLSTDTPTGKLMVNLLSCFSEYEWDSNKIRQKAGILAAKARGVKCGRPSSGVSPEHVRIEAGKGYSVRDICRRLKIGRTKYYELLRG